MAGFLYARREAQGLLEPLVVSWGLNREVRTGSPGLRPAHAPVSTFQEAPASWKVFEPLRRADGKRQRLRVPSPYPARVAPALAGTVDLRQDPDGSQGGYGLTFRHQDDKNGYRFTLTGQGQFEFGREYNHSWQYLENYAGKVASQAVRPPGEWNHLRVVAVGSRITAYVNGRQVAQVTDSAFRSGHVGLLVGTEETGDQVIVAFDDFVVYRHS